ncbi:ABC transporter substrate-binding protein [Effusibacillus lacus]|uniref:ABC transporter substrate-binding protein n=1 Tax=Effusibacillus lacus TaxID=1348429 RepID=A0A292YK84_9BACL|nr:ABC transporter substrate-binding protein [Effusibacillus lacus]TCS71858.1 amino acid/amide ABC transporter substrate-binding protein (HAAT family) [Effusibacillus lacus]GAX89576.1 ABC transporter substrate-binding protein [Effusibacillus lacus]
MKQERVWKKLTALTATGMLAGTMLLAGCGPKLDQPAAKPGESASGGKGDFVIGMPISLSGGTALYGEAAKRGAELAIKEFNEKGGFQGRKAKLVPYDDEANPEKAKQHVQRLIEQDKAVAIIGPANSGNAMAQIPIVQNAKIPQVIPVATGTAITQQFKDEPKNFIFRVAPYDAGQVKKMVSWVFDDKKREKVGLLYDTTGYGQGGKKDLDALLANKGKKFLASESFGPKDTDMTSQLTKLKNAGVDTVIVYGLADTMAQILKSADKIGYKPTFVGSWAFGDPTVKKLAGDLVNNDVHFVQSFTIDQSDAAKAFHEKVVKAYGEDVFPIATAQGYDSTNLVLQAISKAGPDSPEKIRDAIEELSDFKAVTSAPAKPFAKDRHEAILEENMFMATYKNGVIVKD